MLNVLLFVSMMFRFWFLLRLIILMFVELNDGLIVEYNVFCLNCWLFWFVKSFIDLNFWLNKVIKFMWLFWL